MNIGSGKGEISISGAKMKIADYVKNLSLNSNENRVSLPENCSSTKRSSQVEIMLKIWSILMFQDLIDETVKPEIKNLAHIFFNDFPAPFWSLLKLFQFGHVAFLFEKQHFNPKESEKNPYINYNKGLKIILITFIDLNFPIGHLNDEVQTWSFGVLIQIEAEADCLKWANQIFKYDEEPKRYFPSILQLVFAGNYKMAAQWVTLLKLQNYFNVTDILLPLILQNHKDLMMTYLDLETKPRQEEFVKLCDNCCQSGRRFDEIVKANNIRDIEIKSPRQLAKCIRKLCNKYEIPIEQLLNFTKWVRIFVVNKLIFSHYRDGEFEEEDWQDFLYGVVKENILVQLEAIRLTIRQFGDCARVKKWLEVWELPALNLDPDIVQIIRESENKPPIPIPRPANDIDYYQPELPEIIWVANIKNYRKCLKYLSKSKIVGLDSEWKSNFGLDFASKSDKTAVIQMATLDRIYLLDIILLKMKLQVQDWKRFSDLIENNSIIKLAFDFKEDWNNFCDLCPDIFQIIDYKTKGFIDLRELRDAIIAENHKVFPFYDTDNGTNKGLANLVQLCFNSILNKREQISNWERRPLRETQKQYAALDAYCLISIYQVIMRQCSTLKVDLDKLIEQCQFQSNSN